MRALGLSPLLVGKPTLAQARHAMAIAKRAAVKGDLRLGVSRAITAIIQASIVAGQTQDRSLKVQADGVIQEARQLVMGIVVVRAQISNLRKLG